MVSLPTRRIFRRLQGGADDSWTEITSPETGLTPDDSVIEVVVFDASPASTITLSDTPAPPPGPGSTYNIVVMGQSEVFYNIGGAFANLGTAGTVANESNLRIFYRNSFGGGSGEVLDEQITNSNKVSRWMVDLSNYLNAERPDDTFNFIFLAEAGTAFQQMIDDSRSGRDWTDSDEVITAAQTALSFTNPDAAFMIWQNADSTALQDKIADVWFTGMTATLNADGSAVTRGTNTLANTNFDHFLSDWWTTSAVPLGFSMNRYDVLSGGAEDIGRFREVRTAFDRMVQTPNNLALGEPIVRVLDPMSHNTGTTDINHPEQDDDGLQTFARSMGFMALELLNIKTAPQIDTVTWSASSLTLGSSAGNITTLRTIRGTPSLPAGQPKVARFFWYPADGSSVRAEVPDAAISLTGGNIVIDATALKGSNFEAGDRITFDMIGAIDADDQGVAYLDMPGIADANMELIPLQPLTDDTLENDLTYTGTAYSDSLCPTDLSDTAWQSNMTTPVAQEDGFYSSNGAVLLDTNPAGDNFNVSTNNLITVVVDVDKITGRTATNSNSGSFQLAAVGTGNVTATITDVWGDTNLTIGGTVTADDSGLIFLPKGRVRVWINMTHTAGQRLQLTLRNASNGGAYNNAAVFEGHLTSTEVARLGNPTT